MSAWDIILIITGILYTQLVEHSLHRYVLHSDSSKKKKKTNEKGSSWFSFHWLKHHKEARRSSMIDDAYVEVRGHALVELALVACLMLLHVPLAMFFPSMFLGIVLGTLAYLLVHHACHTRVGWAKRHAPWHYDHHMGPDQDSNWCVTLPLLDAFLKTRKRYAGTAREILDLQAQRRRDAKVRAKKKIKHGRSQ